MVNTTIISVRLSSLAHFSQYNRFSCDYAFFVKPAYSPNTILHSFEAALPYHPVAHSRGDP